MCFKKKKEPQKRFLAFKYKSRMRVSLLSYASIFPSERICSIRQVSWLRFILLPVPSRIIQWLQAELANRFHQRHSNGGLQWT